ncbi:hypothetical protein ACCC92_24245 [Mucilaginibacter sp. Mucisp84]|uniref:hypothetical protein n=1 Tax=Mucilaginibacter sp. Mucisp84 TaxID=3243058 RepID=UPI0039A65D4E
MKDYMLDDTNDLRIENGDFVLGDSDLQHQKLLLFAEKGAYKQYPTTGVGIMSFLNDDSEADMLREIRLQFAQDGMQVDRLAYKDGNLQVIANYGN